MCVLLKLCLTEAPWHVYIQQYHGGCCGSAWLCEAESIWYLQSSSSFVCLLPHLFKVLSSALWPLLSLNQAFSDFLPYWISVSVSSKETENLGVKIQGTLYTSFPSGFGLMLVHQTGPTDSIGLIYFRFLGLIRLQFQDRSKGPHKVLTQSLANMASFVFVPYSSFSLWCWALDSELHLHTLGKPPPPPSWGFSFPHIILAPRQPVCPCTPFPWALH